MHNQPGPKFYVFIAITLFVLLALTAVLAFVNLGPFSTAVAFLIAICKAALIVLYFMHLRFSGKVVWIMACGALFWLGIMFTLSFNDYLTRGNMHIPGK